MVGGATRNTRWRRRMDMDPGGFTWTNDAGPPQQLGWESLWELGELVAVALARRWWCLLPSRPLRLFPASRFPSPFLFLSPRLHLISRALYLVRIYLSLYSLILN